MRPWRFATDNRMVANTSTPLNDASMRPWRFATDNTATVEAKRWGLSGFNEAVAFCHG